MYLQAAAATWDPHGKITQRPVCDPLSANVQN